MNHTGQRSFIILESTRKYDYEVIKNIYTTAQSHIQKSSTSFNFLYLKAIIFIHADNVRNSLFKTRPFFPLPSSTYPLRRFPFRLALSFFLFAFSSFSLACFLSSFSSYLFCAHCSLPRHLAAFALGERLP